METKHKSIMTLREIMEAEEASPAQAVGSTAGWQADWHSVKDNYPKIQEDVLVWDGERCFVAWWTVHGEWQTFDSGEATGRKMPKIIYWHTIPNPPNVPDQPLGRFESSG